jgi:hypothetical protein
LGVIPRQAGACLGRPASHKGGALGDSDYPRKETIMAKKPPPTGYREVFCRYIRRNGKIIYPKNGKVFHFYVKA